jgi:hypothetical protein
MVSLPMVCTAGADLDKCPAAVICYRAGANTPVMEIVADDDPDIRRSVWRPSENRMVFFVRLSQYTNDPVRQCQKLRQIATDPLGTMGYYERPDSTPLEVSASR